MSQQLDKTRIIALLKPYFEKVEEVVMAFLFGSFDQSRACRESDIDLAIYFQPKSGGLEWEDENAEYQTEDIIWAEVESILGKEVDLVVLNRAPSCIAATAINGEPIIIKDRGIYLDFMLRTTLEAEDFREFIEDYWKLKQSTRK